MDTANVTCVMAQAESKPKSDLTDIKNCEIQQVIDDYIHSERDRKILKRRYCDDIHLEPLAEEFDLSVKQIQNIIAKHEAVLFRHLLK